MKNSSEHVSARKLLYGYRTNEVDIKPGEIPDETIYSITTAYKEYDPMYRPPMAACIFDTVPAVPPRPDITHPDSALLGVAKRMAYNPPPYKKHIRKKFKKFVKEWIEENLQPLDSTEKFDFEEWLASTNYQDWRKKEIREAYSKIERDDDMIGGKHPYAEVKFFVKEEWYPEYKHFRGIWARCDEFKAICGPFFKKVEEQLFKNEHFIKKIPKDQRPDYIYDLLYDSSCDYELNDFVSYESHFQTVLMDDVEFQLYRYMAKNNSVAKRICQIIFNVIAGHNYVVNKYFTISVFAKRQSGEMNTSLGNGFFNLMAIKFMAHYCKISITGPIVEGDDSETGVSKMIPKQMFIDMGLNAKPELVENLSEASFCGIIFDPEERINIRDPRVPLATIFWVPKKYALSGEKKIKSLVRSKALSMLFEYPGCPILSVLGKKVFELLEGYPIINIGDSLYMREIFQTYLVRYEKMDIPFKNIGQRTRALMESKFDISVEQQILIENSISNMTIEKWDTTEVLKIMPDLWVSNYENYVKIPLHERLQDLNTFFTPPPIVNKFQSSLYIMHKVSSVKHQIGKILPFAIYSRNSKFKNLTIVEISKEYKKYLANFSEASYRLKLNLKKL